MIPYDSNSTAKYISKSFENRYLNKILYVSIYTKNYLQNPKDGNNSNAYQLMMYKQNASGNLFNH